jgi:apolipoprotein N-acyltransferase
LRAASDGRTLIAGTFRIDGRQSFNTALILRQGEGPEFRDKHALQAFSEFIPPGFGWLRSWLSLPYQDLSPGSVLHRRTDPALPAVLICQDIAEPDVVMARGHDTGWMLLISDLSWFPDGRAERHMSMMARWRAAEAGRWLLMTSVPRGAVLISAKGSMAATPPQGATHWNVAVPRVARGSATWFARYPYTALLLLTGLAVGDAARLLKRRNRDDVSRTLRR